MGAKPYYYTHKSGIAEVFFQKGTRHGSSGKAGFFEFSSIFHKTRMIHSHFPYIMKVSIRFDISFPLLKIRNPGQGFLSFFSCFTGTEMPLKRKGKYCIYKWRIFKWKSRRSAPIAQLDRVFDYESKGCGFDSCSARHKRKQKPAGAFFVKKGNEVLLWAILNTWYLKRWRLR